jgi:glycosyltransferase involved in cell wall biosynthesis
MVEALACGTPVVALRRGSVPEIVIDGQTGFVCDDASELPDRIRSIGEIQPRECRRHAKDSFDVGVMVEGYERLFNDLVGA